jgi:putative lipoprotein
VLIWLLLAFAACVAAQAADQDGVTDWQVDHRPLGRTLVYVCPDFDGSEYEFIARLGPGEMAVWLPDRYRVLSQVRSASGVKYQEGEVVFWTRGDQATLWLSEEHRYTCRYDPARAPWADARRRGASFRAVGNEPGWYLEIGRTGDLLYVGDYGSLALRVAQPSDHTDQGVRVLAGATGAQQLRVEIIEGPCTDSMSGAVFPYQVIVQLPDASRQGCGRALIPLRTKNLE